MCCCRLFSPFSKDLVLVEIFEKKKGKKQELIFFIFIFNRVVNGLVTDKLHFNGKAFDIQLSDLKSRQQQQQQSFPSVEKKNCAVHGAKRKKGGIEKLRNNEDGTVSGGR